MSLAVGFPHQQDETNTTMAAAILGGAVTLVVASMFGTPSARIEMEPPTLADTILSILSESSGMNAKDILKQLKAEHPDLTKKDVNSNLYKLLGKKRVKKDASTCPIWTSND